jgi:predicted nuclease with RNAse H fold
VELALGNERPLARNVTACWLGIDLGASAVHAVVLAAVGGGRARVEVATSAPANDIPRVVELATGCDAVAVDAPSELSRAPHSGDSTLSAKFRTARCGEIELGRGGGIWVPWATPADPDLVPGWMEVGFEVWSALRSAGHAPVEVYPYGVFKQLAGGEKLAKKTSPEGRAQRIAMLRDHVDLPPGVELWSHDGIDAVAAALVARWSTERRAEPFGHGEPGCDGSAIWQPKAVS